jgi:hypothetical protein
MPLKVSDYSWSETEQMVFITVPLKVRREPVRMSYDVCVCVCVCV